MFNANIRIINEKGGRYYVTAFNNCSYRSKTQSSLTDRGLQSVNITTVRIPKESVKKPYIDYRKWQALSDIDCTHYWTLDPDKTYITLDDIETEITSLTAFLKSHEAVKVFGYADNNIGSMPHWRIDCK